MDKIISDRFVVEDVIIAKEVFSYPDDYWDTTDEKEAMIKELIEDIKCSSHYWHVSDRISGINIPIIDKEEAEILCGLLNELPESYLIGAFGDSDVYDDDTLEKKFTVFEL